MYIHGLCVCQKACSLGHGVDIGGVYALGQGIRL